MKKTKPIFGKANTDKYNPPLEAPIGNKPTLNPKPLVNYQTIYPSPPQKIFAVKTQFIENTPPKKNETQIIQLEKFIPRRFHEEMNLANHPHYINLYSMGRRFLSISFSNHNIQPKDMSMPYSEGFPILKGLIFIKILQSDPNELQVILYKGSNGKEYVLKRFIHWLNFSNLSDPDYKEIDNFLQRRYLE